MKIYDLEQEIIRYSQIVDDLRSLNKSLNNTELESILQYYDFRFNELWSCYEKFCLEHLDIRKRVNENQ